MNSPLHLLLLIEYRDGRPLKEPVHAVPLSSTRYRLMHSPGFVQGIAAGDEFELRGSDGAFDVVRRSGNVAVQVYSSSRVTPWRDELVEQVQRLGGVLDGAIERGLVFTLPISVGFQAMERVFNAWVATHAGCEWHYGNVYDTADGVTPLSWWNETIS